MATSLKTYDLEKPLVDSGIRSVNFFNGRLLTAHDLRREQEARHTVDGWLGQAVGDGVAYGLELKKHAQSSAQDPMVSVEPGLAVNRDGQALRLKSQATIALVRKYKAGVVVDATFVRCGGPEGGTYIAGPGVYLLTLAPARAPEGKSPTNGLETFGGTCNTDSIVETVQFRLLSLETGDLGLTAPAPDPKTESLFRNRLAALCLGLRPPDDSDPFAHEAADPVAEIVGEALSDCDVPLGVLYWTLSGGIRFIDEWSVRRRLLRFGPTARQSFWLRPRVSVLGEARLLQFSAHLNDLLRPDLDPEAQRIEDFFRYVPPAACIPVTGAGSASGFRPVRFLASYTHGAADRMAAGMVAAVLDRSFAFGAVDLSGNHCLQRYEIDENVHAVTSGKSTQRYHLFVSRSLHGPASRDPLTAAFADAWTVFRGLIRRRVFVPPGSTPEELAAQVTIIGAIRDVMDIGNRHAATAATWGLDPEAARSAFHLLYEVEQELKDLLSAGIPGIGDSQERELFVATLNRYLNVGIPGPKPSLKAALDSGALCDAVLAQAEINKFVGTWTGEGVAIGPFGFTFNRSDGTRLVPGAPRTAQFFELRNGTDKTLTMMLTAEALAATGDWSDSTRILGSAGGAEIDRVTLSTGASREIVVMVGAPADADAQQEEPITLTLTAEVGPPTSRTSTNTNSSLLKVSETGGGPVAGAVDIRGHQAAPGSVDLGNIAPSSIFGLVVSMTYASSDATPRRFDLRLAVLSGDASLWTFREWDSGALLDVLSPPGGGYVLHLPALPPDGVPRPARIRIQAPARHATVDRSLALRLSAHSLDVVPPISDEYAPVVTMTVRHA